MCFASGYSKQEKNMYKEEATYNTLQYANKKDNTCIIQV